MTSDETWRAERAVLDAALALEATAGDPQAAIDEAFTVLIGATRDLARLIERDNEWTWVERTWRDVRQGDVIRPVGRPEHAVRVEDIARHTRTARRFTLLPHGLGDDGRVWPSGADAFTRDVSAPDGAIEIWLSRGEVAAIEALGGWGARMGVIWDG